MKFISHIVLLAVGFGLGIWWGVYHPTDAARMTDQERAWLEKGKTAIDQQINKTPVASTAQH